jgi:hypothetical protein
VGRGGEGKVRHRKEGSAAFPRDDARGKRARRAPLLGCDWEGGALLVVMMAVLVAVLPVACFLWV